MSEFELMPGESVVWETITHHIQRWWFLAPRQLILTNWRLILSTSGFDPASDSLSNLFTSLLGRKPKVKIMWETPLDQLAVMTRTKFGLNKRVLRIETKSGDAQRVIVDKVELWIDTIYETVNSTGSVTMLETEPDRWVVS